jgi:hypothetical protein
MKMIRASRPGRLRDDGRCAPGRRRIGLIRVLALLPLALPLTGAAPAGVPAGVNEAGRVLAQLDDVRAIYFVLIVVILMAVVLFVIKVLISNLTESVRKLASALEGMTKASADRTTAEMVHNARMESIMSRVDAALTRIESDHG